MNTTQNAMLEYLRATAPNEQLSSNLALYGQFLGSWHLDIDLFPLDGFHHQTEGEVHFAWVLEGRAIQDIWIYPAPGSQARSDEPWSRYGTTFRWYDPAIDAWHITWYDPRRSVELRQIGRAQGEDIVQIGEDHHGLFRRWRFTQITSTSFVWLGEVSWDKGLTWTLETSMRASKDNVSLSKGDWKR